MAPGHLGYRVSTESSGKDEIPWVFVGFFLVTKYLPGKSSVMGREYRDQNRNTQNRLRKQPKRDFVSPNCLPAMASQLVGLGGRVFPQPPALSLKAHPLGPFPEVF